jgi:hypothetical protein
VPKTCATWADAPLAARPRVRHMRGRSWPARAWDDLRLVGLKLMFLIVTRAVSLLGLSRREWWWKDAEILMLRHQLAVAERERVGAENTVTSRDLRIFVDQAAKPVTSPDAEVVVGRCDVSPADRWFLAEGPVVGRCCSDRRTR